MVGARGRRVSSVGVGSSVMPGEAEINAAAKAMMEFMFAPHELPLDDELQFKYKALAHLTLEAAEQVRDELCQNCKHPRKLGGGALGSDGSSSWSWHCPDCGKSDQGNSPGDSNYKVIGWGW